MEPNEAKEASPTVQVWKQRTAAKEIECPNGLKAFVTRRSIQVMLKIGLFPNELMPLVQKMLVSDEKEGEGKDFNPEDLNEYGSMIELIDRIVVFNMVDPNVFPIPKENEERESTKLYVDELEEDTKMFIYNYVMTGETSLVPFRDQPEADVEDIQSSEDLEHQAEPAS